MSKTIPTAFQAHLDSGATTLCLCWRVERNDGIVQGFTEHDCDLVVDGQAYTARSGFTATQVAQSLGLAVDNLEVDGALSDDTINEDDLAAGRYDDADVELLWVNWDDTSMFVTLARGSIGEVKRQETAFSAEFRSLTHRLNQKVGRTYQRTCDVEVGSPRCRINLTLPAFRTSGSVLAATGRSLTVDSLDTYDDAWFSNGVITFNSGANSGLSFEVKHHSGTSLTLWEEPPSAVLSADTFTVTAGCQQTMEVCRDKFNNLINFQGFPDIPGSDAMAIVAVEGQDTYDGGSLR